jgi:hypothetical protein
MLLLQYGAFQSASSIYCSGSSFVSILSQMTPPKQKRLNDLGRALQCGTGHELAYEVFRDSRPDFEVGVARYFAVTRG